MKNKKKEKAPILYEKFKKEKEDKPLEYPKPETKKNVLKILGDMLIIFILMGMIFLSAIGTVTLINPVLKNIIWECIYQCGR